MQEMQLCFLHIVIVIVTCLCVHGWLTYKLGQKGSETVYR